MAKKAKIEETPTKEKRQNSGKKETTKVKKETPITTEVKEEVKQVFKKALNGIQFESGKATIKSSSLMSNAAA